MTADTIKAFEPLEESLAEDPPAFLQKLFCHFLQSFFIHDEFKGTGMHWVGSTGEDVEETTEMIITSEKPMVSAIEKVPHLVCVLGAGRWANLGLDQLQKLNMSTGERQHTDLMPMTMAYHCQAKNGNLARRIAWYSSWGTIAFRRILMKQGGLHHVSPSLDIGPETGPTAYTGPLAEEEVVSVQVNVPFYWQPQWRIRDPAPVFQRFEATMGVRTSPVLPVYSGPARRTVSMPIEARETGLTQRVVVTADDTEE